MTVVLLILTTNLKTSYAGRGRPYCSVVEFNGHCFSTKNSSYLISSFINQEKKDSRYTAERKWDVLMSEGLNSALLSNTPVEKKITEEEIHKNFKTIKEKNIFLINFLENYTYKNSWCNDKFIKALKFATEIQKHIPNNEITDRLSAGRIIMSGNFCFQMIGDNSKSPKNYSLIEIYPEFESIMSPIINYKFSNEEINLFAPWYNYLFGAIAYNDALELKHLYNSNLQVTPNYFEYFQDKNLNQHNLKEYPRWIVEATNYMNLLVKFKRIRFERKDTLIDIWLKNYRSFINNFPQSEFNNHLKNIEFGIHKLKGDNGKFVSLFSNELNKTFSKIEEKKPINWLDQINLQSVPLIFSGDDNFNLPQNSHSKLRLFQLLTHNKLFIKSNNLCDEKYDTATNDSQLYFNKICNYIINNQYPNSQGFRSNWYKIQASYFGINLAIKNNKFNEAVNLMKSQKEIMDENSIILLVNQFFFQAIYSQNLETYFQSYLPKMVQHFDYFELRHLAMYQFEVYSKFLSKKDDLQNTYLSLKNFNNQFSLILPQVEQALLYGDKSNALIMLNQINLKKISIPSKKNNIIKLLSIKNNLNSKNNNSLINMKIGNYIYREEIIPICYQMPPNPIEVKMISKECGYFLIDQEKDKFEFIPKSHSNIGLVPINIFKNSLNEIKNDNSFDEEKYNLLKRMIFCMKGYERRFYCTRNADIKKSEPIKWFRELNEGKERQKHWYYEKPYYDLSNWPFYDSDSKRKKERVWKF